MIKYFILNLLIWIDQGFNVLLLGSADETLSSRAYRAYVKGRIFGSIFKPLIDTLFFFDPNHCESSYNAEVSRRQLPLEFRGYK